eukprot:TRINITY_DN5863_c0_g2_i2.p1 TRINITY_DN5863_c0_g2~~TRINITY_DN5863_c0_g2_i2.p1  ORF type:complete len:296 (+),score=79.05 TRINITY_DN5863_c0_g2_i2:138-1025(+)
MIKNLRSVLLFLGVIAMATFASGATDDELFAKYQCHGPVAVSEGCTSKSYNLALQAQWVSNGETYYQYQISLTNLPASDFPISNLIFGFNVGGAAGVFTQTWGLRLSSSNAQGGNAYYGVDFGSAQSLAPGSTWQGSGFVVKGHTATMYHETSTCDYSRYVPIKAARCSASSTTGAPVPSSSSSTTGAPSSCNFQMTQKMESSWPTGSVWTVTVTALAPVSALELRWPGQTAVSPVQYSDIWNVAKSNRLPYIYLPLEQSPLAVGTTWTFGYVSKSTNKVQFGSPNGCGDAYVAF